MLFNDAQKTELQQKQHLESVEAMKRVATVDNDDKSFFTVGHHASEEDGRYLMIKTGLSFYRHHGVAVRGIDGEGHIAGNMLRYPLTEGDFKDTIQAFYNLQGDTQQVGHDYRCVVSTNKQRADHYTPEVLLD